MARDFSETDRIIKQVILKKMQIDASVKIPQYMIDMTTIDQFMDVVCDNLIIQLRTYLTAHSWTENISKSIVIEVPLTWLDAVRIRFAPKLLAKKFPIKYRKINTGGGVINNYWIFPEVPPNPDKHVSDFIMSYMEREIYK